MSGIGWVLMWSSAVPLLCAIAALATPIHIGLSARSRPRWQMTLSARLYGGLTPPIPIVDTSRPRRSSRQRAARPPRQRRNKSQLGRRARRAVLAVPNLLTGLLCRFRLERVALDADVGLSDPADTGQLVGEVAVVREAAEAQASSFQSSLHYTGVGERTDETQHTFVGDSGRDACHLWFGSPPRNTMQCSVGFR